MILVVDQSASMGGSHGLARGGWESVERIGVLGSHWRELPIRSPCWIWRWPTLDRRFAVILLACRPVTCSGGDRLAPSHRSPRPPPAGHGRRSVASRRRRLRR